MKNNSLTVVIPCLNEKRTIKRSINDVKVNVKKFLNVTNIEIIIADNGSTDGSLEIIKKIKGIKLINVPVKGYGAALHWGIMNSKSKYVIFADADLSYPFSNISQFIKYLDDDYDLILGSRIKGSIAKGSMPLLHRYLGTPVLTFLIRFLYKIPTTDCNSGMRMVKRSFYTKLNMRNSGMEWASELLLKIAMNKGKYFEVPITFNKDKRGKKPHLSTWPDGWRHLKAIILLKPSTLIYSIFVFAILALLLSKISFSAFFFFVTISIVTGFSYLTLDLLSSIINKKISKISSFLMEFKLVPFTLLFTIVVCVLITFIPDSHLGTKLLLTSILGITFMWIFLIETIKTHLINKLPDLYEKI